MKKIRLQVNANKARIMLILLGIFAILISISSASAIPGPSAVYVNTTGNDTSGTGTADNPFQTIQKGVDTIGTNGTVFIADGVYSGTGNYNIKIHRDMTIKGQSQNGTILNGTNSNRVFDHINYNVILQQLTIVNSGSTYNWGGAVNIKKGNLTAIDCTFKDNNAYNGGAVNLDHKGEATATLIRCTFINNHATERGGAIFSWNGNSLTVKECTFINNTVGPGGYGGAIFLYENQYFEIIGNHFLNNNGSAIYINSANIGTATKLLIANKINFNRFFGNTQYGIYYDIEQPSIGSVSAAAVLPNFDAKYNWWGSNAGPNTANSDDTNLQSSLYTPWIVMKFSPSVVNMVGGTTTTIVANFLYDNLGGYHDPANGHIPDNTPVLFTTTLGQVGSQQITKYTVNGVATAILKAWNAVGDPVNGIAYLTATTDAQTLTGQVTITPKVNAASEEGTVGMQETGLPIAGLILAILAVLGGSFVPRRK